MTTTPELEIMVRTSDIFHAYCPNVLAVLDDSITMCQTTVIFGGLDWNLSRQLQTIYCVLNCSAVHANIGYRVIGLAIYMYTVLLSAKHE